MARHMAPRSQQGKSDVSGDFGANVIRAIEGKHANGEWHYHKLKFQMVYILKGSVEFEYEGEGVRRIEKGDVLNQRPGIKHREIACSNDFEVLEIVAPANFETRIVEAPDSVEAAE